MLSRTRDEIEGKAVADIHPDQAAEILSMMERGAEEGLGELSEPIILPVTPAVSLSCRLMCTPQGDHWLMVAEPIYQAGHYSLGDLNDTEQVPRLKTSLDYVISQARLDNEHIALVKLSVERFNWLQETLGEQAAEQVMSDVAERIQVGLRRYDTLYRIRNDRLLIQLRHVGCSEEAFRVANSLNEVRA